MSAILSTVAEVADQLIDYVYSWGPTAESTVILGTFRYIVVA
jgi:hypothetical protein